MNYFHKRENVNTYKKLLDGYDNSFMMNEIDKFLPEQSSLLELGMGTGIDLLSLAQKHKVLGTDASPLFVEDFHAQHPQVDVRVLDAVTMNINQKFDCIFSNKVLQHLTVDEFKISLQKQYEHLNKNGIVFMTLWHDKHREELLFDGELRFTYYQASDIKNVIPPSFEIEHISYYAEIEQDDSMLVVLRAKGL